MAEGKAKGRPRNALEGHCHGTPRTCFAFTRSGFQPARPRKNTVITPSSRRAVPPHYSTVEGHRLCPRSSAGQAWPPRRGGHDQILDEARPSHVGSAKEPRELRVHVRAVAPPVFRVRQLETDFIFEHVGRRVDLDVHGPPQGHPHRYTVRRDGVLIVRGRVHFVVLIGAWSLQMRPSGRPCRGDRSRRSCRPGEFPHSHLIIKRQLARKSYSFMYFCLWVLSLESPPAPSSSI
jgi:hypothetical protein